MENINPSFKAIIDKEVARRSQVLSVADLGFSEMVGLDQINRRLAELGFLRLDHETLHGKCARKLYAPCYQLRVQRA